MFDHLAVNVDYTADALGTKRSYRLYIPGSKLLEWVQAATQAVYASAATLPGKGTKGEPYLLGGYSSYVGAWKSASAARERDLYFSVAGRLIHKIADGSHGGFADGCYMADDVFSGTDPRRGTIWNRKDGASYREFGKFIHEGNTLSGIEGVVWSQRIASQLRMVLKGKTGAYAGKGTPMKDVKAHGSRWSVDMNPDESARKAPQKLSGPATATKADTVACLPLLSAVMFISEPTRNPRAWLMGLMMLDLMGAEYMAPVVTTAKGVPTKIQVGKHFTFQRALVHPSRLDDRAWAAEKNTPDDRAPAGWVDKQARRDERIRHTRPLTGAAKTTYDTMTREGSAAVEGLYPPSPKWSGRSDKNNIEVANDYIQAKEVSLVCRWLEQEMNRYLGNYVVTVSALAGGPSGRQNALTARFPESAMRGFAADLERVVKTELLARRAASFDSPGVLFK